MIYKVMVRDIAKTNNWSMLYTKNTLSTNEEAEAEAEHYLSWSVGGVFEAEVKTETEAKQIIEQQKVGK